MFEKLTEKLCKHFGERPRFDPARFGDPVAMQTEWTPIKRGGTNFRTHTVAQTGMARFEFRASAGAYLFYLVFLVAGLAVAIGIPASEYFKGDFAVGAKLVLPLVFGLVFASIGGGMLYFGTLPIIFDKGRGFYWKGRTAPYQLANPAVHKNAARLSDIHALQLISELCRAKNSNYYSYELNLVLENGRRLNVVDHGNLEKIRTDTAALARFLGKPAWDAA